MYQSSQLWSAAAMSASAWYLDALARLINVPLLGRLAHSALFEHHFQSYDILISFIEAHDETKRLMMNVMEGNRFVDEILRESHEQVRRAEKYMHKHIEYDFPEVCKALQHRRAMYTAVQEEERHQHTVHEEHQHRVHQHRLPQHRLRRSSGSAAVRITTSAPLAQGPPKDAGVRVQLQRQERQQERHQPAEHERGLEPDQPAHGVGAALILSSSSSRIAPFPRVDPPTRQLGSAARVVASPIVATLCMPQQDLERGEERRVHHLLQEHRPEHAQHAARARAALVTRVADGIVRHEAEVDAAVGW